MGHLVLMGSLFVSLKPVLFYIVFSDFSWLSSFIYIYKRILKAICQVPQNPAGILTETVLNLYIILGKHDIFTT